MEVLHSRVVETLIFFISVNKMITFCFMCLHKKNFLWKQFFLRSMDKKMSINKKI